MKWTALIAASAISLASLAAGAAPARPPTLEKSPDILRQPQHKRSAARTGIPLLLTPDSASAAAPTVEDVGDPDSFGRNVTYLGLAQTLGVVVLDDCSTSDPEFERCIVANPPPASTSFNESNLATINLPPRATKSLVCFAFTPVIQVGWQNFLAGPAQAQFFASSVITIDNDVLDDPTLIDPNTGLPFGGVLSLGLSTYGDSHTLQSGETDSKTFLLSRACIAGLISKRVLVDGYGLTETQATQFFKKPMTITFGARGSVALAGFASYFYGIRLYGD